MDFCEKCGGIILLKDGKAACASCGHKVKKKIKIEASEKIKNKEGIVVIKETDANTYPIVQIKCVQCDNNKAFFWTLQTRSSDESETKFYKCTKCKHTWRVYR
ncbi:MAG TPA: transcription factor S [Candidatus Nanoarchaeia archaeon]|nr:transcription factor S [Candidatus Nanoarchaeia archaeon]